MRKTSPSGPLIPESTNFYTNFSRILKVTDELQVDELSSGDVIIVGGRISGLKDPVEDDQAATLSYVQANGGGGSGTSAVPGGNDGDIQYNDSGDFKGIGDFNFSKDTNTFTASNIEVGNISIGSGTISGLNNPVTGDQAATKNYVDNASKRIVLTEINDAGPVMYPMSAISGGIILRDNQSSGKVVDTLPTAAEIISSIGSTIGTSVNISIRNTSTTYTSTINLGPSVGVTFDSLQNIYPGYQFNGIAIVTGANSVHVYTLNNNTSNTKNWTMEVGSFASTVGVVRVTDYLLNTNRGNMIEDGYFTEIGSYDLAAKVKTISHHGPVNMYFKVPGDYMGVFNETNIITGPFLWKTGGSDFYLVNRSTDPSAIINVDVELSPNDIDWEMDPNFNGIIPPGYTGRFIIALTVGNYPDIETLTSARIYSMGVFPNR